MLPPALQVSRTRPSESRLFVHHDRSDISVTDSGEFHSGLPRALDATSRGSKSHGCSRVADLGDRIECHSDVRHSVVHRDLFTCLRCSSHSSATQVCHLFSCCGLKAITSCRRRCRVEPELCAEVPPTHRPRCSAVYVAPEFDLLVWAAFDRRALAEFLQFTCE